VAACVLGGLSVAWCSPGAAVDAVRIEPHARLGVAVLLPPAGTSTHSARALLPDVVPHRDAAFNAGRAALLVTALRDRLDLLPVATEDRLHQPYRASAAPVTEALVGPSVLVLGDNAEPRLEIGPEHGRLPAGWRWLDVAVERRGVEVVS
jgi:homoserine kinase